MPFQKAINDTIEAFGTIEVVYNNTGYELVGAFEAMEWYTAGDLI